MNLHKISGGSKTQSKPFCSSMGLMNKVNIGHEWDKNQYMYFTILSKNGSTWADGNPPDYFTATKWKPHDFFRNDCCTAAPWGAACRALKNKSLLLRRPRQNSWSRLEPREDSCQDTRVCTRLAIKHEETTALKSQGIREDKHKMDRTVVAQMHFKICQWRVKTQLFWNHSDCVSFFLRCFPVSELPMSRQCQQVLWWHDPQDAIKKTSSPLTTTFRWF